jgi:hypothetical protein
MKREERYNGWKNYVTWVVNLWLEDEESSYNYWSEQAATVKKEYKEDVQEYTLADMLKDDFELEAEHVLNEASVYSDILRGAISEVDFREIAKGLLDEVETNEEDEEEVSE